jgi:hypothetical protein
MLIQDAVVIRVVRGLSSSAVLQQGDSRFDASLGMKLVFLTLKGLSMGFDVGGGVFQGPRPIAEAKAGK